jgi:hypothetical protein
MSPESKQPEATTSDSDTGSQERGLTVLEQAVKDACEVQKAQRSSMEDEFMRNALAFMKTSDSKWADARSKGPSPSDFGDHKPIPIDSVCLSPVLATDERVVDDLPETIEEFEQDKRRTHG